MRSLALTLLIACGAPPDEAPPEEVVLRFAAEVDGAPWSCGASFEGGAPATSFEPIDLRLYLHDVVLLGEEELAAPLVVDAPFQSADVALVDLAGAGGPCDAGSPEIRDVVRLAAPAGAYTGVRFTLGVHPDDNHLNSEDATPPFDQVPMWWGWRYGYKYVKLDVAPTAHDDWVFHMGASGCDGDEASGYACTADNLAMIELDGFDPASGTIVVDVGALLSGTDLDGTDGCQTGAGDLDCAPLFERLGLGWEGSAPTSPQAVFSGR